MLLPAWHGAGEAVRSGKTAYKWVERYDADPAAGLAERSRAPPAHGRAMAGRGRATRFWRCGGAHPHWGPKKLRAVLQRAAAA